ncbi:acyl-CoA thioester hydrolase [Motilibacter rhizosphaerae]|uniref:Acyl-CoA thioester hydrolase n=1 Tax=Motilibacter rhizosphaerae TaxID=598652 RepID=A0A4Q7NXZ8_9ACTN|nr:thioesterase family protein [Motilibacter rhizosphaerae]RZS91262.1 acyl-CoA thioester hydrolase [Motilibacter rhizosphaerae]
MADEQGGTPGSSEIGAVELVDVHFDDLDALGMLHNSRYVVLVERALASHWTARGYTFRFGKPTKPDVIQVVRELRITYSVPVLHPGPLAVHFWVEKVGTTSVTYRFRVESPDRTVVHAEGARVVVRVDPDTGRPTPWTEEARRDAEELLAPAAG